MRVFKIKDRNTEIVVREYFERDGFNARSAFNAWMRECGSMSRCAWKCECMSEQEYVNGQIDTMEFAMNDQPVEVGAHMEFWVVLKSGIAMPVARVEGAGVDMPFRCMTVYGYKGEKCQAELDLMPRSVRDLCGAIIDILY
jgi:hypothetical protein